MFWDVLHQVLDLELGALSPRYLLRFVTAVEADIIEAGIIQAPLVLLHLGLDAADPSTLALAAPVSVLPPVHARGLQDGVTAAAELDVVDGRVVAERTLVGLHTNLEGGENPAGAVLGMGPLTEAGRRRAKSGNKTNQQF